MLKNININIDLIKKWSKPNNVIAVIHLAIRFSVEIFLFYASIKLWEINIILSLIVIYICAIWHNFWGYAGLAHELYHRRVFTSRFFNELIYYFATYITWNNPAFFRKTHGLHHAKTFLNDDKESKSEINWSFESVLRYILFDYIYLVRKISFLVPNVFGYCKINNKYVRITKSEKINAQLMILTNILLQLLIWIIFKNLLANAIYFILPFTGQILIKILAKSQHVGLEKYKHDGPLLHSRTIILPYWLEFLYAGMNYHREHHLLPGVPYYYLNKVYKEIVSIDPSLKSKNGFNFIYYDFRRILIEESKDAAVSKY